MRLCHNLALACILSAAHGCSAPDADTHVVAKAGAIVTCIVSRIADGDTFLCRNGDRVRLLLIDTPELAQGAVGRSSMRALAALIPIGSSVRLEFDVAARDRYDRLLAYVHRGDLFVNREMARSGMAVALVIPPNIKHVAQIRAAVDSARKEGRGLWRGSAFNCIPQDYRLGRCGR